MIVRLAVAIVWDAGSNTERTLVRGYYPDHTHNAQPTAGAREHHMRPTWREIEPAESVQ